ncbi:carbohydrate esterase family 8 protein [Trichoderma virens Gv29-8]|uniref:pectinesterase n=1 Tax=Hypocrea virens (strain Gv29-8 / FGSC 10586) TaxID=413071 RepID=G9MYN3_HYPVG|nr:carbohydrate esterase family 8 protein [Trichoderma virens Gv29-8]EHK20447.1 carbohydrate esterase family 8 protein [Trichoderma virens Gv29-8]
MGNICWNLVIQVSLVVQALSFIVLAAPAAYVDCQIPSPDPLANCPNGTILVSASGSHDAQFNTIQSAIDSLPHDMSHQVILILPGNYGEQLNITRPGPVTLLGQTPHPTIQSQNQVQIHWAAANVNGRYTDNAFTAVLTVAPTLESSLTGSGPTGYPVPPNTPFGCVKFSAYNIDFRNVYAEYAAAQSLAVSISYANAGFYWCGIYSYQDTVYVGKLGNAYFYRNEIAGQVDFLYGFGTGWVQHSNLTLRSCGGGITAWKGTNTTFSNKYGIYISDSFVNAANSSIAASIVGKCYLGRPWNNLHRSVFLNTRLDASISPGGYKTWSGGAPFTNGSNYGKGTLMAEYEDYGPGFNTSGRLAGNITTLLRVNQARQYRTPRDVFMTPTGSQPNIAWIDAGCYTW